MRQGTTLETIRLAYERRLLDNQQGPQGPGARTPLPNLPPEQVQILTKNVDGSYSSSSGN